MATAKYTALAEITLSSTDTSVTFASIPAGYRDLFLVIDGTATAGAGLRIQANGDTGSNYSYVYMQGSSGGAASSSGTNSWIDSYIATTQSTTIHEFLDYKATDKHKPVLTTRSISGSDTMRIAQRWASSNAINSLYIYLSTGSFAAGTTFCLYGVK
jgi:hypothetical protein